MVENEQIGRQDCTGFSANRKLSGAASMAHAPFLATWSGSLPHAGAGAA